MSTDEVLDTAVIAAGVLIMCGYPLMIIAWALVTMFNG